MSDRRRYIEPGDVGRRKTLERVGVKTQRDYQRADGRAARFNGADRLPFDILDFSEMPDALDPQWYGKLMIIRGGTGTADGVYFIAKDDTDVLVAFDLLAFISGGAPANATFITQTANGSLSNEQALAALATGLLKVTTGTGVLSAAVAGTDYVAPGSEPIFLTLGPYLINDLPATATTTLLFPYFNTASAVSLGVGDPKMQMAGKIVGAMLHSDAARAGGSATLQVRINGTPTAFAAGAVAIDGTNTVTDSHFVAAASGLAFSAGDPIGVAVVTSSWSPTTANILAQLYLRLTPL